MPAFVWLLSILVLAAAGCGDSKLMVRAPPPDELEIGPSTISFGDVLVGERVVRKVEVRSGDRPASLQIDASSLPPCFEVSPQSIDLEARQAVEVELAFLPSEKGFEEGSIGFLSDEGLVAEVHVDGRGVAEGDTPLVVDGDLDFGDVRVGQEVTRTVTFVSGLDEPFEVRVQGGDPTVFQWELERFDLAPRETRTILVTFRPTARGTATSMAWVEACRECELARIPMSGRGVIQALRALPARVSFQRTSVASGLTRRQVVTITNTGDLDVELGAILAEGEGFSVVAGELPRLLGAGERTDVEASFTPTAYGTSAGRILVGDPHGEELHEVPLLGPAGGPLLRVDPESIDFGTLPAGASSPLVEVSIENIGDPGVATLVGAEIVGAGSAHFQLDDPEIASIAPRLRVPVRFAPMSEGDHAAELVLRTDLPEQPELRVSLTGAGVESDVPGPFEPVDICQFRYWAHPPTDWDGRIPIVDAERVEIVNNGTEDCLLWDFRMSNPGTFYVIDAPPGVTRLAPGQSTMVEYGLTSAVRPNTYYLGNLVFETQAGPFHFLWIGLWSSR